MESVSTFFKEENDFLYRKGYAVGYARGYAKGLAKSNREAAAKMKEHDIELALIADITGLSTQEIEKL